MSDFIFESDSVDTTIAFGERLSASLQPNDVLALSGELGCGKTHFAKGVATGFGIDSDVVNSPTFVLLQQYEGRLNVFHFDTYRLGEASEFEDIGGIDVLEAGGVSLIEWPERVEELLPDRTIWIRFEPTGEETRSICVRDTQGRASELVQGLGTTTKLRSDDMR